MKARNWCYFFLTVAWMAMITSCSSRKHARGYTGTRGAKAAEAMAALGSKQLYRFITDWTGVPYRLGGLDKKGIDCSGFALLLNQEIYGQKLPRRSRDQAGTIKNKDLTKLEEGDLIFFSFGGREVDHVGIYLNNGYFVHASTSKGVIVDDLNIPAYQRVLVKAGSVRK